MEFSHRVPLGAIAGNFPESQRVEPSIAIARGAPKARWATDNQMSFKELGGACRRPACSRGPSGSAAIVRGRWRMPRPTPGARVDFRSSGECFGISQFRPFRGNGIEPHVWRRRVNGSERPSRETKKRRNLAEFIDTRSCIRGVYALTTSAMLALRTIEVSDQFRTWQSGTKGLKKLPLCATFQVIPAGKHSRFGAAGFSLDTSAMPAMIAESTCRTANAKHTQNRDQRQRDDPSGDRAGPGGWEHADETVADLRRAEAEVGVPKKISPSTLSQCQAITAGGSICAARPEGSKRRIVAGQPA